ncbi:MAG: hypothetical protein PHW02_05130 [bacterium]|nr:hypothetical protein [bacterium]
MIFVSTLEIITGKTDEALELVKTVKPAEDVKVLHFLQMFGKPDFFLIFEAPNEEIAMDFVLNFSSAMESSTQLGVSVDEL